MKDRRRCNRGTVNADATSTSHAAVTSAVEMGRAKILRHQNANQLDAFTTLAELMTLGSRDSTRTYNPLLSVTTV